MNKLLILLVVFCQSLLAETISAQVVWQNKKYDVDSLVPLAINYLREGKLDQSVMLSRTVLAKYPQYTDFNYILGLSYQKMGRGEWAIPYFETVIASDAKYKDSYSPLALLYEVNGEIEKARKIWQQARTRFPDDMELAAAYREFEARGIKNSINRNIDIWYKEGRQCIEQGELRKAIAISDSMQRADASDNRYLYLRSSAYMSGKDYNKAKIGYEMLWDKGDSTLFMREQLANIAAANKDYHTALVYMKQLQRQSPQVERYRQEAKVYRENLPYNSYLGLNHTQSAQDRPNGHFFISGVEYGKSVGEKNMVIGQFNYGNRRGEKGYQVGVDTWLNYSAKIYAYHHLAWADGTVFPTWRAAYSLYREVGPWLFDVGGRYVRSADHTDNYGMVASAGRYFGSTFVYLRGFLLHDEQRWNQAYSLAVRHYYNNEKPNSYVTIIGNIGTSPDDPSRYQFLNNRFDFLSRSINAGWQHRIDSWGFTLMGGWSYYKVAENRFMNQYDLNLSLRKYF
ncbi:MULTISPECIES: YaiO family outer membrane beta-barrel protein [unclassified Sphingobacterium]|uniref:YaiO family outer membrane beta-barrel protein n=1 Tax=unclassified Sphingobacterium TaxID=2609468 RepID=UPI0025DCB526|nr:MULTISPECIES: YaiO family outer membrane beta-barrel protein [unclassified Sphingobacterium]